MSSHPLYGKKKKGRVSCPNKLFISWLTEWRDEAAEKGWKSQYTYHKALTTLKKFPLYLASGKDCKILENFGDKICKMLDDRLAQHAAEHGSSASVPTTNSVVDSESSNVKSAFTKESSGTDRKKASMKDKKSPVSVRKHQHQENEPVIIADVPVGRSVHTFSDDSDKDDTSPEQPRKRQRSGHRNGVREYIPLYRSGPYAILRALYTNLQTSNARGFMTKLEIIRAAQPLADTSFTMPESGSRYTAWSAMGTLIKKHLVNKESSPAKYSLTDAGCELAHKLEAVQPDNTDNDENPFRIHQGAPVQGSPPRHALPSPTLLADDEEDEDDLPAFVRHEGKREDINKSRLSYWYVTEHGEEVLHKDRAAVLIDDELSVGFLVKCNYTELLQSGLKYKLDTSRPLTDISVYVYLSNDDTPTIASPSVQQGAPQLKTDTSIDVHKSKKRKISSEEKNEWKQTSGITRQSGLDGLTDAKCVLSVSSESSLTTDTSRSHIQDAAVVIGSEESSLDSVSSLKGEVKVKTKFNFKSTKDKSNKSLTALSGHNKFSETVAINSQSSASVPVSVCKYTSVNRGQEIQVSSDSQDYSQDSIKSLTSVSSMSSVHSLPPPDFVLMPGMFDIILCVDNQEFYGRNTGGGKNLLPDLIKNGVECDLRKLQVGDLLWIAREKQRPVPGQLGRGEAKEVVLDFIIERKRMDDLVSSCIDGRFKEQKFRLKKCGLRKPMYLIEDYGSMQHFSIPESSLEQAIVNTQVIDGFQVKRTKGTKETVAFLTVMTRYLQSHFRDKTLYASRLEDLQKIDFNLSDAEYRLATFEEFNQGSVKTKALTVQEMFGKQLIQLHGMSAEKARAVIDLYPTPSHLLAEYEKCSSETDKETLLSAIKCGKSARSFGLAPSKQIYQLYCTRTPLT